MVQHLRGLSGSCRGPGGSIELHGPTWEAFTDTMARAFELETVVEEARQQILNLRQTGRITGYVQRFRELLYKIQAMKEEESYTLSV